MRLIYVDAIDDRMMAQAIAAAAAAAGARHETVELSLRMSLRLRRRNRMGRMRGVLDRWGDPEAARIDG